jgi:predicted phage replisome organizer
MGEVKWIKLAADIFDNRKIRQIESLPDGDAIVVIWLKLLCLAGNINDSGLVYFTKEIPYTEEMMATQFNRPLPTIKLALQVFEQFGMIKTEDDLLKIANWEKYQNLEGLEKIREQNRIRKQNQRERERLESKSVTDSVTGHVTVTQCHAIDKDIDIDIDIDKEKEREGEEEEKKKLEQSSSTRAQDIRHKYGEYKNVLLSDKDFEKLREEFPADWQQRIESLSAYIASTGKTYKNHLATIRNWARRDQERGQIASKPTGTATNPKAQELNEFYDRMAAWAEKEET